MNPLAQELNETIKQAAPSVCDMLSSLGEELYFPKGILSQTAEAKQKANRHNATIGMAKENDQAMYLQSVMKSCAGLSPDEALTYAPAGGVTELRAKWKEEIFRKTSLLHHPAQTSLPIVTSGITHGLSLVADLFVDPADIVMLPEMAWGNYNMIFGTRHGADIQKYPFFVDNRGLDTSGFLRTLESHSMRGKLVVLLNFPNNPTGYSATEPEVSLICDALLSLAEHDCRIVAVCDDAYFGLSYDPDVFGESIFGRLTDLHKNIVAVKLDGATKEDYVWGFRVGFITFAHITRNAHLYEALEKKTAGAIRGNISNCPHISQSILLRAMSDELYTDEKQQKFAVLKARAVKVKEVLADDRFEEVWTSYPFNSGYFMCLKLKDIDAETFRVRLLNEYGVGVIAIGKTDIRVAFSCIEEADIPELFELMFQCAKAMAEEQSPTART